MSDETLLAEAEKWLRSGDGPPAFEEMAKPLADELDRLRAEVARLSQPTAGVAFSEQVKEWLAQNGIDKPDEANGRYIHASYLTRLARNADDKIASLSQPAPAQDRATRLCWVGAESEEDACEAVANAFRVVATDEDEPVECDDEQEVYEVELRARKVQAERAGKDRTGT